MDRADGRGCKGIMSSDQVSARRIKHSAAQDVRHSMGLVVGGLSGIASAYQRMPSTRGRPVGAAHGSEAFHRRSVLFDIRPRGWFTRRWRPAPESVVGPGAGRGGFDTAGRLPVAVAHRQLRGRGHRRVKWHVPDDRHCCRARIEAAQSNRCRRQLGPVPAPRSTEAVSADA